MIGACFPFLRVRVTEINFQNTEQKLCIFVVLSPAVRRGKNNSGFYTPGKSTIFCYN